MGGSRGAITKIRHRQVNLTKHFNVHECLYRQFLIKIKYICDSGSLSFNFGGVCKIDIQQTSNDKGKPGNVSGRSIKQITTETSQTFFSLNHSE